MRRSSCSPVSILAVCAALLACSVAAAGQPGARAGTLAPQPPGLFTSLVETIKHPGQALRREIAGLRSDLRTLRTPEYRGQRGIIGMRLLGRGLQYGGVATAIAARLLGGDPWLVQSGGGMAMCGTAMRCTTSAIDDLQQAVTRFPGGGAATVVPRSGR